jgi:hypothetical protein
MDYTRSNYLVMEILNLLSSQIFCKYSDQIVYPRPSSNYKFFSFFFLGPCIHNLIIGLINTTSLRSQFCYPRNSNQPNFFYLGFFASLFVLSIHGCTLDHSNDKLFANYLVSFPLRIELTWNFNLSIQRLKPICDVYLVFPFFWFQFMCTLDYLNQAQG